MQRPTRHREESSGIRWPLPRFPQEAGGTGAGDHAPEVGLCLLGSFKTLIVEVLGSVRLRILMSISLCNMPSPIRVVVLVLLPSGTSSVLKSLVTRVLSRYWRPTNSSCTKYRIWYVRIEVYCKSCRHHQVALSSQKKCSLFAAPLIITSFLN